MRYAVEFSAAVDEELQQLFDFVLQRELDSAAGDLDTAERALQAIRDGLRFFESSPFACRKVGSSPFLRELIIPFGSSGYVALFEIIDNSTVIIGAVRHQRDDDYH